MPLDAFWRDAINYCCSTLRCERPSLAVANGMLKPVYWDYQLHHKLITFVQRLIFSCFVFSVSCLFMSLRTELIISQTTISSPFYVWKWYCSRIVLGKPDDLEMRPNHLRVATYHPSQNSLIFPWHFTVFHTLWQIKTIIFILCFGGAVSLQIWGLLLKERICSLREQIFSLKRSPQWREMGLEYLIRKYILSPSDQNK